jgi:hypothetical protein
MDAGCLATVAGDRTRIMRGEQLAGERDIGEVAAIGVNTRIQDD